MRARVSLDAIVTVVDARHVLARLEDSHEALEQIAFADIILTNKIDLVDAQGLEEVRQRIRGINSQAKLIETRNANAPRDQVPGQGAFDLDRILEIEPSFLGEDDHEHDETVTSVSVSSDALHARADRWLAALSTAGWRQALVSRALRDTSHPLAIFAFGMIFGLVFDTVTQAAAWGTAASLGGGVQGAILVAAAFAAGMVLTDTADSQIVARLLRAKGDPERVRRYRRGVGWLIVALSFGMAAYAPAGLVDADAGLPDDAFNAVGLAMALIVVGALALDQRRREAA